MLTASLSAHDPEQTPWSTTGIQFASQIADPKDVTASIAMTKIMTCPRTNFGRSAASILIIMPPEHIEV